MSRLSRLSLVAVLLIALALPGRGTALDVTLPAGVSERRLRTEVLWSALRRLPPDQRPRVTLVLGGGGARGLAHIGVLRVLEQEGIPIDEIVGVSVGALIGALYAGGLPVEKIDSMANDVGWDKLTDYSKFTLLKLILADELLSSERMEDYLDRHIGGKLFSDLNIPFTCVATDIRTGERVVFREGPVAIAARASATIPAVFRPVEYRQRLLVDGGLVDNLPTDLTRGGDRNRIIVAVLPKIDHPIVEEPSVFRSLIRSIDIQKDVILRAKKRTADFVIEPNVGTIGMEDLDRSKECIEAGVLAARETALGLKELILTHHFQERARVAQR